MTLRRFLQTRALRGALALAVAASALGGEPAGTSSRVLGRVPASSSGAPAAAALAGGRAADEPVVTVDLIDNGGFQARSPEVVDERGVVRLPWWRSTRGQGHVEAHLDSWRAVTRGDDFLEQPLAAWAPLVDRLVVEGVFRGAGRITITDGQRGTAVFDRESATGRFEPFRIEGAEIAAALGRAPVPRLELRLEAQPGREAQWDDVAARVALPAPSEAALRAEILGHLRWIFDLWLEKSLDELGPRRTAFCVRRHDVLTGETVLVSPGMLHPLWQELLRVLEIESVPAWRAELDRFLEDFLTLGLHPATGLPAPWDPERDEPVVGEPIEIASALGFLIDVAEHGPPEWRERCRAAAVRAAETVLATGVQPDGAVAPRYWPATGVASTHAAPIRRLDVPAQLGRLGALTGEERFVRAAREAVARLEYTHYWAGTWKQVDPGFDDNYGHYGARAVTLWRALPEEPAFRRLALSGYERYAPMWYDSLRLGGYNAADQVRCWRILKRVARLEPDLRPQIAFLLKAAARSHFKCEQYGNGGWGDVTYFAFDPRTNLQVGDMPNVPMSLLRGLALVHDAELGQRDQATRGMFIAVMRSSYALYRRPYGFLATHARQGGTNPSGDSLRFAVGLVEMLRALED